MACRCIQGDCMIMKHRAARRAAGVGAATALLAAGLIGLAGTGSAAAAPRPTAVTSAKPLGQTAIPQVQPLRQARRLGSDGTMHASCSVASLSTPTTSNCWSGYVQQRSNVNTVSASWTVPSVSSAATNTGSSSWVGVDGWGSSSLIQTGTAQYWNNGSPSYYAWWEVLPANETRMFDVSPGDAIYASITHLSGSQWAIYLTDRTNGRSISTTQTYSGPQASAEFIHEAPSSGGNVVTLSHTSPVPFYNAYVNGTSAGLTSSQRVSLVQNSSQVETPSAPNEAVNGFTMAYSASTPLPPATPLFQLHNDGTVWASTGAACGTYCTGWTEIDNNPATAQISAGAGTVFERHTDGSIWQWTGTACGSWCSGWVELDNNARTTQLSAGSGTLFQLHSDGSVWRSTGIACTSWCSGWTQLDGNPGTVQIAAGAGTVFQRHSNGQIWRSTGAACSSTACPGWTELDNNPAATSIAANASTLFQLHGDGTIWRSTGAACTSWCAGWTELGNNAHSVQLAAGGGSVYQRQSTGAIYRSTGAACGGGLCTGWTQLDNNPAAVQIVASSGTVYQRHGDGSIWRSTGVACSSGCPGWQPLDNNPRTVSIAVSNGS